MADPGDPEYHRRNVILPEDYATRVLEWHGGQGTMVYSLGSTGMSDYVSPSMIDAAVHELERDYRENKSRPKDRRWTKAEMKELETLIGDLDSVARFSSEFTIQEATGEDTDSGYATWLMEEDETVANPSSKRKLKNRLLR